MGRSRIVNWTSASWPRVAAGAAAVCLLAGLATAMRPGEDAPVKVAQGQEAEFAVDPPPFSEGIFPCSDCHEGMDPDFTVREVSDHEDIELDHGPRERWCFDCHNPADRDQLRLASGSLVPFTESYRLCGQCHGDKFRDWKVGVHGKRTGEWSGEKHYLLCAHCHNPHSPAFEPIAPMPAPVPPGPRK